MRSNLLTVLTGIVGLVVVQMAAGEREVTSAQLEQIRGSEDCEAVGLRPQVCHHIPGQNHMNCQQEIDWCDYGAPGQTNVALCDIDEDEKCEESVCLANTGDKTVPDFCAENLVPFPFE